MPPSLIGSFLGAPPGAGARPILFEHLSDFRFHGFVEGEPMHEQSRTFARARACPSWMVWAQTSPGTSRTPRIIARNVAARGASRAGSIGMTDKTVKGADCLADSSWLETLVAPFFLNFDYTLLRLFLSGGFEHAP